MIISQCRIQGRGPGGPGPLISGSGWPAPLYLKVWIRHSALEGGKAGKMTRELLDDTSEKKGTRWVMRAKQENTSRKRSSLLYSCFLCLLCKFSLSQCCTFLLNRLLKLIHSEMLARKSAICRFIGVFFPSKYINKQPNKMARFAGCLREDISNETHQSGPDFENMDDAVSLYRKFQGTLFQ